MHSGIPMEPMTDMQIGLWLRECRPGPGRPGPGRPGSGRPDSDHLGSDHLGSGHLGSSVCMLELDPGVVCSVAVVLVV
jgi:hypothetical protein